ncbi:MAG TPA: hypothetical protein ENI52_04290 [Thermoplasmata archaeon]|nr:hypothetical protein [Thermoplasmata archaeon]
MGEALIPEIHDIGKLTNKKHNFEELNIDLNTATWKGIQEHHCSGNFTKYPTNLDTFLLCIADSKASAVSRAVRGKGHAVYNVYKLWKPPREKMTIPLIKTDKGIQEIINFIASKPTADEFFRKYERFLKERSEDANPGCNITSLYVHSKLTGQFYRILKSIKNKQIKDADIKGKTKGEISNLIRMVGNKWKITVLKVKIHFPQNPVRAKDMNVFKLMEEFIGDIKKRYPDNVMFSTSNELLILSPVESNLLEYMENRAEKFGFWLEIKSENQLIRGLNLEKMRNVSSKYFELSPKINPPICEICQLRKASREIVEGEVIEHLCEKCFNIRNLGATLPKLADWEKTGNPKVVYIKISLEMDELVAILKKLYISYLKEVGITNAEEVVEIRFSLLSEFQTDYNEFLSALETKIINKYGEENVQQILKDFLCIKIEKTSEIKQILKIYSEYFKNFFPKFRENLSPIKVSLTCANVKFPFIWNWKILDNPKDDINVSLIGKGEMNLKAKQIDELLNIKLPSIKLLHDLSRTSEISKKLAWIMLNDKSEKQRYREFEGLRKAILSSGIDYDDILIFAKIMGG